MAFFRSMIARGLAPIGFGALSRLPSCLPKTRDALLRCRGLRVTRLVLQQNAAVLRLSTPTVSLDWLEVLGAFGADCFGPLRLVSPTPDRALISVWTSRWQGQRLPSPVCFLSGLVERDRYLSNAAAVAAGGSASGSALEYVHADPGTSLCGVVPHDVCISEHADDSGKPTLDCIRAAWLIRTNSDRLHSVALSVEKPQASLRVDWDGPVASALWAEICMASAQDLFRAPADIASDVRRLVVTGWRKLEDGKGFWRDTCVVSTAVDRDTYDSLNLSGDFTQDARFFAHLATRVSTNAGVAGADLTSVKHDSEGMPEGVVPHDAASPATAQGPVEPLSLTPMQFQEEVTRLLERMRLTVSNQGAGADGGIDIVAVSDDPIVGGRYVVQCKRYARERKIGVSVVRDLYGVVTSERASKGVLIATCGFTQDAHRFAEDKPLELIDGAELSRLLASGTPGEQT